MTDRTAPKPVFPRWSLRRQCLFGAAAVVVAVGMATALGYCYHAQLNVQLDAVLGRDAPCAVAAAQLALDLLSCRHQDRQFEAALDQPQARGEALRAWNAAAQKLQKSLASLLSGASGAELARIEQWRSDAAAYCHAMSALGGRAQSNRPPRNEELRNALQSHRARLDALADEAQSLAAAELAQSVDGRQAIERLMAAGRRLIDAAVVVSILVVAAAACWITRAVLDRVDVVSEAFGRLAAGNLKTRLACGSRDEIGLLSRRFNDLASAMEGRRRQEPAGSPPQAEPARTAQEPVPPAAPSEPQPPQRACRVLVAEDGPENRRFMSLVLSKAGAEVTVAENGAEAVQKALAAHQAGRTFDVILMDVQMPVLNGYEAARRLRQQGYTGQITAVTAHSESYDRQKCLDAGCDSYLVKPLDRETLVSVVASLQRSSAAARQSG